MYTTVHGYNMTHRSPKLTRAEFKARASKIQCQALAPASTTAAGWQGLRQQAHSEVNNGRFQHFQVTPGLEWAFSGEGAASRIEMQIHRVCLPGENGRDASTKWIQCWKPDNEAMGFEGSLRIFSTVTNPPFLLHMVVKVDATACISRFFVHTRIRNRICRYCEYLELYAWLCELIRRGTDGTFGIQYVLHWYYLV